MTESPSGENGWLVFEVGAQRLAVDVSSVHEVVRAVAITPLPGAPDVVAGTIDVRGRALPVYDLRLRFGMEAIPLEPDHRFVLARAGDRDVALWVDVARRLDAGSEVSVEPAVTGASRHVSGVVKGEDGLLVIQDLEAFLSADEVLELERSLAAKTAGS